LVNHSTHPFGEIGTRRNSLESGHCRNLGPRSDEQRLSYATLSCALCTGDENNRWDKGNATQYLPVIFTDLVWDSEKTGQRLRDTRQGFTQLLGIFGPHSNQNFPFVPTTITIARPLTEQANVFSVTNGDFYPDDFSTMARPE
jgi:hypothetical protein